MFIAQRHFDGFFQNVDGFRHQWTSPTLLFGRLRAAELQPAHCVLKKAQTGLNSLLAPLRLLADGVSQS